ncbi:MAG TPA: substrate-binding domain-containing protein, partial [Polyangiaceae bacterium]|nr:substrate-binding domain-containing protein [Polyangiaceae bacterium]
MSRITIGVLLDHMNYFGGSYEAQLRECLDRAAREHDLNLLIFYGHALDEPSSWGWTHNVIFDLVSRRRVNGLIVVSSTLATYCGAEGISRLVKQYRGLPACSIGLAIPDTPSVIIDNQPGMAAVLEHVMGVHHARRIAFLSGSLDSDEARLRLDACVSVFERFGVPWDDSLVECGNFVTTKARAAMRRLLDRHPDVEAVVAANDSMAFGAMDVLRERGRRVPEDVLVTGFDDLPWAALGNPALTTVAQPLNTIAEWAVGAILGQINGIEVPRLKSLPTRIVVRNSCGCRTRLIRLSNGSSNTSTSIELLRRKWRDLEQRLTEEIEWSDEERGSGATILLSGLDSELNGVLGSFEAALELVFKHVKNEIHRIRQVQNAITILYELLRNEQDPRLENMWFRAMSFTLSATLSLMVQQSLTRGGEYVRLTSTSDQISGAFDLPSLRRALAETLPGIGVNSLYVCYHPSGQVDALVPLVHLRDGQSLPVVEEEFDAQELYPNDEYLPDRRHTSLVFPLALEGQHLGLALIEYEVGLNCYHIVRDQATSALRAVALHQAVVKQTMLHERTIQERASTSKRLQALSVLAGGVAHDLN